MLLSLLPARCKKCLVVGSVKATPYGLAHISQMPSWGLSMIRPYMQCSTYLFMCAVQEYVEYAAYRRQYVLSDEAVEAIHVPDLLSILTNGVSLW